MAMNATSPLRWLMLASHVPASGSGGGMVRYAVEMARALQDRHDVELSVVAAPEAVDYFVEQLGLAAHRVHRLPTRLTVGQAVAERMALSSSVDIHHFDVIQGTKHLLPRTVGPDTTTVLTVHDMLMLDRRYDFGVLKRRLLPRPYLASIEQADVLACVSHATAKRLAAYAPGAGSRVSVVPLAMSSALLDATPVPVAALAQRPFALVVGDPSPRKNIRHVTSLWSQVLEQVPEAVLALVGPPGWGKAGADPEVQRLVASGAALQLGHLADGELRWAYEHTAVTLCPSLLEGFGLPALEAVTFDSPLILSEDPAMAEASGGLGQRVPLHDQAGWVAAVVAALRTGARVPPPQAPLARRWSSVAQETVLAARSARAARTLGVAA
jgi:glycosyltransferase involved in cell wall biosynthesis